VWVTLHKLYFEKKNRKGVKESLAHAFQCLWNGEFIWAWLTLLITWCNKV